MWGTWPGSARAGAAAPMCMRCARLYRSPLLPGRACRWEKARVGSRNGFDDPQAGGPGRKADGSRSVAASIMRSSADTGACGGEAPRTAGPRRRMAHIFCRVAAVKVFLGRGCGCDFSKGMGEAAAVTFNRWIAHVNSQLHEQQRKRFVNDSRRDRMGAEA